MTYAIDFKDLTIERFMSEYWQKKPLLIKDALSQFVDPIEADELAGLAMESDIESRIIAKQDESWAVEHGPFEDFSTYGEQNWTLLVQAVNNWHPKVNDLISAVSFLPNWRIDDVMVSFSTPNGGVGPHLDQYDVFIIQGMGKRHWRVGNNGQSLTTLCPHPDLKQVSAFNAVIDEITEAGDLLYIPPGCPHDGIALENALNYSIGFQAPHAQELLSGFADLLLDEDKLNTRFSDKGRKPCTNNAMSKEDFLALKEFMMSATQESPELPRFIGQYLTKSHHELDIVLPDEEITDQCLLSLEDDTTLNRVLGLKVLIIENLPDCIFVNGETIPTHHYNEELVALLLNQPTLTIKSIKSFLSCLKNRQLLTSVINNGLWYLE